MCADAATVDPDGMGRTGRRSRATEPPGGDCAGNPQRPARSGNRLPSPGKVQDAKAVQALLTEAQDFLRKRVPGPLQYSVALFGPAEWAAINQPSTTYAQFNLACSVPHRL